MVASGVGLHFLRTDGEFLRFMMQGWNRAVSGVT